MRATDTDPTYPRQLDFHVAAPTGRASPTANYTSYPDSWAPRSLPGRRWPPKKQTTAHTPDSWTPGRRQGHPNCERQPIHSWTPRSPPGPPKMHTTAHTPDSWTPRTSPGLLMQTTAHILNSWSPNWCGSPKQINLFSGYFCNSAYSEINNKLDSS